MSTVTSSKVKRTAILAFTLLLLIAEMGMAQDKAIQDLQKLQPPAGVIAGAAPNENARRFRLSPGDAIEVKFFYNKELNDAVQLRPDGFVSLQLVGEVELSGKTVDEAARTIEQLYGEYLLTPSVTIEVRSYSSRKIFVGGEVERAGVLELREGATLLSAIVEAGGAKRTGNNSLAILIRRDDNGQPTASKVLLGNQPSQPSAMALTVLRPFDIVLVPESRIARLNKWMDQYIKQMSPLILTAGFSYFTSGAGSVLK